MVSSAFKAERASRRMIHLRDAYLKAFPDEKLPIDPAKIAEWAYRTKQWVPKEVDPVEVLRRKLSHAFRREYMTDPQDREVRASVPVVIEEMTPEGPKRRAKFFPLYNLSEHPKPANGEQLKTGQ